jgi:transcription termination factor NusB
MMFRFCLHSLFVTSCLVSLLAALPARSADPPARSQGSPVTVMDNQGRVLKTLQEPPTKEALAAKAAEEERQRDKAKADAEQARKDRILLDSYTTEAEIDLARNRASQALEQQMEIARSYMASLVKRQAELQKQKAELGGKGLPPAEEQELARLQAEVEAQHASVLQKKQDLDRIIARYAADKRRWQEIGEKQRLARPEATSAVPTK